MLQLCRFAWAGLAQVETYAMPGDTTLELVFYGDNLAELRQSTANHDLVICYRQKGWPMVAVTRDWSPSQRICTATGQPIPLPENGPLQVSLQKLTSLATNGPFSSELSVYLGTQPQPAEAYCGSPENLEGFLRASEYLVPADEALRQLAPIRDQ
ncbi:hypothetical protein [Halovulum sp. GXIMD14793]